MYCQIMISKILEKTQTPSSIFIDGDSGAKTNCTVVLKKGLAKGDYLITYRAEYDDFHHEKKLVVGSYNHQVQTKMNMLDPDNFTYDRFSFLVDNLESRMNQGERYVQPDSYLVD
jgi:hypothetical protein